VFTGDKPDAGTDANVFVNIIGEHGESGKRKLDNLLKDDFERGKYVDLTHFWHHW
jgi:PLAT/LH2 domain